LKYKISPEHRLAWLLCAPAMITMLAVTAYPIAYAFWLSLHRFDLRFPDERSFVGIANYVSVLTSEVWWQSLINTMIITIGSVSVELVLGIGLALCMHHAIFARRTVRTSILIPYGIITVVAAFAWKFAFDPTTGFVNAILNLEGAWLTERWSSFLVIILAEIWKTTPFMALLLLAGLATVPEDLHRAARVDGASSRQRFFNITLPLLKPAILVALLFRTLDAFRIFDTVFVLTRGAHGTESVSLVGYNALIVRLNLGLGSAVSVLIFACVIIIAFVFVNAFGVKLAAERGGT